MKNSTTTVIEITETHIKLLQSTVLRGASQLTFCDIKEIAQSSDEELSKKLAVFFSVSRIKPENIIGVIARQFAILRHVSLPSHNDEEIAKMISLQAVKQIPYPKEDIILDYVVLEKDPSGYAKVLVIAVHKDVTARYLKIFEGAHCPVNQLTLSSVGIAQWYLWWEKREGQSGHRFVVIINIDVVDTEVCFCSQGQLLFSRNINFGAKDLNEEKISQFIEEIDLTLETYTREAIGGAPEKMVVASPISQGKLLQTRLEAEYQIPVVTMNSTQNILLEKNVRLPDFDKTGASVSAGLGLVLGDVPQRVNLMPKEISSRRETKKQQQEYFKCLGLFVLLIVLLVLIFSQEIYKSSVVLSGLQKQISAAEPRVKAINEKKKHLEFMKNYLNPSGSAIDVIRELYNLTPPDVSFSVLYLDENGSFNLQGVSETGTGVNVFQRNLVGCPLFKDVTLQYATKRKIFKGELTDFKITCQLFQK